MKFDDAQLQEHFNKGVKIMTGLPEDLRPICALLDAYNWFRLTAGENDSRVREVMSKLTSAELRPALRRWFNRIDGEMNPAAMEFHRKLELAIGEELPLGINPKFRNRLRPILRRIIVLAAIPPFQALMVSAVLYFDSSPHHWMFNAFAIAALLVPFIAYVVMAYKIPMFNKWPRPVKAGVLTLASIFLTVAGYTLLFYAGLWIGSVLSTKSL
jgi:hypothetical protein